MLAITHYAASHLRYIDIAQDDRQRQRYFTLPVASLPVDTPPALRQRLLLLDRCRGHAAAAASAPSYDYISKQSVVYSSRAASVSLCCCSQWRSSRGPCGMVSSPRIRWDLNLILLHLRIHWSFYFTGKMVFSPSKFCEKLLCGPCNDDSRSSNKDMKY